MPPALSSATRVSCSTSTSTPATAGSAAPNTPTGVPAGAAPYAVTTQGEGRASAGALMALCMQMNFVLDTATGTLHSAGNVPLPEMTVASVREERGRPARRSTVALQPPPEVMQWVGRQLQRMPKSGAASTEMPLVRDRLHAGPGGTYEGRAQVRVRWSFEGT